MTEAIKQTFNTYQSLLKYSYETDEAADLWEYLNSKTPNLFEEATGKDGLIKPSPSIL